MGSQKRERQKANRQLRKEEQQKVEAKSKRKQQVIMGAIVLVAIGVVLWLLSMTGGDDEPELRQTVPEPTPAVVDSSGPSVSAAPATEATTASSVEDDTETTTAGSAESDTAETTAEEATTTVESPTTTA